MKCQKEKVLLSFKVIPPDCNTLFIYFRYLHTAVIEGMERNLI